MIGLAKGKAGKTDIDGVLFQAVSKLVQIENTKGIVGVYEDVDEQVRHNQGVGACIVFRGDNIAIPINKVVLMVKDFAKFKSFFQKIGRVAIGDIKAGFQTVPFGHNKVLCNFKDFVIF